jgi:hypothetical protein
MNFYFHSCTIKNLYSIGVTIGAVGVDDKDTEHIFERGWQHVNGPSAVKLQGILLPILPFCHFVMYYTIMKLIFWLK